MTTSFSVSYKIEDFNDVDPIDLDPIFGEFGSYQTRVIDIVSLEAFVTHIQIEDDDLAAMFMIKYGDSMKAKVISNDKFKPGFFRMAIGG